MTSLKVNPLHYLIFSPIIITMPSRHTAYPQYQPPLTKAQTPAQNILSVSLLQIGGIDARSAQKTPAGTTKNEHPCTFFVCEFAVRTRFCLKPLPSLAVLIRRGFSKAARMPLVLSNSDVFLLCKKTRVQILTRKSIQNGQGCPWY